MFVLCIFLKSKLVESPLYNLITLNNLDFMDLIIVFKLRAIMSHLLVLSIQFSLQSHSFKIMSNQTKTKPNLVGKFGCGKLGTSWVFVKAKVSDFRFRLF